MIIKFTEKFGKYDPTKVGVSEEVPDGIALEIIRKGYAIPDGEEEEKPKDVVIQVIDARTITTASVKTNKKPVKNKKK